MDITKQVLSIKQMQYLVNLGLDTSDATMCWIKTPKGREVAFNDDWTGRRESLLEPIPAYTLQDIIELLPESIKCVDNKMYPGTVYWYFLTITSSWMVSYDESKNFLEPIKYFASESLLECIYQMLCWCVEKGHIKTEKEETE